MQESPGQAADHSPVLAVSGLSKRFGARTVVSGLDFQVRRGEVLALIGENGAGKSTTKNMLCGVFAPSEGAIVVDGHKVDRILPHTHRISAVHQELSLFPKLSVAENICIALPPERAGLLDYKAMRKIASEQLDVLGVHIDPDVLVEQLGVGQQQLVEIAKALLTAERVLILDEPTTSLTAPERERLFQIIDRLKSRGLALVFISHFLDEVFRVSDRYAILRDGEQIETGALADISRSRIEELMVGRVVDRSKTGAAGKPSSNVAMCVRHFNGAEFRDISFEVRRGEVLGLAGLMGAGRTELAEALFGLRPATGQLEVAGKCLPRLGVAAAKAAGMAYVPEDRRTNALFLSRPVRENFTAATVSRFVKRFASLFGFVGERSFARTMMSDLSVSAPHIEAPIEHLSGGNQQKVVLGRWLSSDPLVCILDEPTKGVDVGAREEIHRRIAALAAEGMAILMISSDLPELLETAHRILVMRAGRLVGDFEQAKFDPVRIISVAAGSNVVGAEVE